MDVLFDILVSLCEIVEKRLDLSGTVKKTHVLAQVKNFISSEEFKLLEPAIHSIIDGIISISKRQLKIFKQNNGNCFPFLK